MRRFPWRRSLPIFRRRSSSNRRPLAPEALECRALLAAPADFDGDGRSDLAIFEFDASTGAGRFTIERSTLGQIEVPLGRAGDAAVVGDFDGDGRADPAVYGYSPADGYSRFEVLPSGGGPAWSKPFGGQGDKAVVGDYDGDGRDDLAVYGFSPANGYSRFAVLPSGGGPALGQPFGGFDDAPVIGDFDGDGRTDFAVTGYSPAEGFSRFATLLSGGRSKAHPTGTISQPFGGAGDAPTVGDFDGDGRTDVAVYGYSPANGYSRFAVLPSGGGSAWSRPFGGLEDAPVPADYDGDGRTDLAVYGYSPADDASRFAALTTTGGAIVEAFGTGGATALPSPVGAIPDQTSSLPTRPPFQIDWVNRGTATDRFAAAERAVIDRAIAIWESSIVDNNRPDNTLRVTFEGGSASNVDMGGTLGLSNVKYDAQGTTEATIRLDADGGGYGWFVDPTPGLDEEFPLAATPTYLTGGPSDRFDLLSTVVHELGHALGLGIGFGSKAADRFETDPGSETARYRGPTGLTAVVTPDLDHLDPKANPYDLMAPVTQPGTRTLPTALDLRLLEDIYNYRILAPMSAADHRPPTATGASLQAMAGGALVVVVSFDEAVDPLAAEGLDHYVLFRPEGTAAVPIDSPFTSAEFDTSRLQVRLRLRPGLQPARGWALVVQAPGDMPLADPAGNLLDGDRDGLPGGAAILPLFA